MNTVWFGVPRSSQTSDLCIVPFGFFHGTAGGRRLRFGLGLIDGEVEGGDL